MHQMKEFRYIIAAHRMVYPVSEIINLGSPDGESMIWLADAPA